MGKDSQHAKFSPSGAHRWIACPGSIRLSENIESRTSEYAMEGTGLHTITEQCLRGKMRADEFIGMAITAPDDPDWSMQFDDGHAEAVQMCIDHVHEMTAGLKAKGGRLELRVKVTDDCWGTVDVLLYNEEWVFVTDFKFGRGKSVQAEGNSQLMLYGLGALRYMHDERIPIPPNIKLVIIQPRIPQPIREWDTTVEELKTWFAKSVAPAFDDAGAMNSPCNPGEEQCQFCPANGMCTARANFLLGIAQDEFKQFVVGTDQGVNPVPMVPDVKPLATDILGQMDSAVELLTPEIAGKILEYQVDFDNFFKRVGEFALLTALDGGEVPGFKLVRGKSNRKWKDAKEAEARLKSLGIADPFGTPKLLSPAQAEKKLKKLKGEIVDYFEKPLGKLTLVDEHDSREEADITGEADMSEFATTGETVAGNTPDGTEDVTVFKDDSSIDDIMADFEENAPPPDVKETVLEGKGAASPPSKRTKKYQLMIAGLAGGVQVQEAANNLFKGDKAQVMKGLRQLNERDGYTIMLHSNDSFTVKE